MTVFRVCFLLTIYVTQFKTVQSEVSNKFFHLYFLQEPTAIKAMELSTKQVLVVLLCLIM